MKSVKEWINPFVFECLKTVLDIVDKEGKSATFHGTASVNPQTGENTFIEQDNGMCCYAIKKMADSCYENQINEKIRGGKE